MPRPLRATYRLQLEPNFTFDDAAAVVPYLAALGVSHVYCSPYLQAAPGSTHGYDVIDPTRVSDDLGGPAGHARLVDALRAADLGHVLDIVPNHLAARPGNPWWEDVLENGRGSLYANLFDIDWDPPESKLRDLVLLPILGDHYGRVLDAGELALERRGGRFVLRYYETTVPLAPESTDVIVAGAALQLDDDDLAFLSHSLTRLPAATAAHVGAVYERYRDAEVVARLLAQRAESPEVAAALDRVVAEVNTDPDLLHSLLERQHYRLARWQTASEELDYRRFFDIDSLVALRMEDPAVFNAVHGLAISWVRDGVLDGLRIDHPDGLRDPVGYFHRLRAATTPPGVTDTSPRAGSLAPEVPWIVAEKIVTPPEELRPDWPVHGTTGYEAANLLTGLFIDPDGAAELRRHYREFTGTEESWEALAGRSRREVLETHLAADVNRVVSVLAEVCERHRRYRDFTRRDLRTAVIALAAAFPVYRTYVRAEDGTPRVDSADRAVIDRARARALEDEPALDHDLVEFVARVLTLDVVGELEVEVALRFQQLTAPATAKGVEDTAFYRYAPLSALNEVGGYPDSTGVSLAEFHAANRDAQRSRPWRMVTTSTHDTKRSEDVRARIVLLSEVAAEWAWRVQRWHDANARHRSTDAPDPAMEWLLYQAFLGAHPLSLERAIAYAEKAAREAKTFTSWTQPDIDAEKSLHSFVSGALSDEAFVAELGELVARLAWAFEVTSLAMKLLALTIPGVPDIYQGSELIDLSLVDPDNRRPVDYEARRRLLAEVTRLAADDPAAIAGRLGEGLGKLHVVRTALAVRSRLPTCFGPEGTYEALSASGTRADHVVAYRRGSDVIVVAPRLLHQISEHDWDDTALTLPPGTWRDELSGATRDGGTVELAELLSVFPAALLTRSR